MTFEREPDERDDAGRRAGDVEGTSLAVAPGHPGEHEQRHRGDQRRDPDRPLERLGEQVVVTQRAEPTTEAGDAQRHAGDERDRAEHGGAFGEAPDATAQAVTRQPGDDEEPPAPGGDEGAAVADRREHRRARSNTPAGTTAGAVVTGPVVDGAPT